MQSNTSCQLAPWALRRRFAPLAAGVLALMTVCAGTPAWADEAPAIPGPAISTPTPDAPLSYAPPPYPVASPVLAGPAVPEEVQDAVITLARACAAWRAPQANDGFPRSRSIERDVCDLMTSPTNFASALAWFFGIFGAMTLALGLVFFCFLRAVLVMAWNWRPRSMARMQ